MRMCDGMSSGPSSSCSNNRVFRNEPLEKFFEIPRAAGVRVLHDDEAATGVLDENGHGAGD